MGRAPCCDKANVKKGPWSPEEDAKLKAYIEEHGIGGNWIALPHKIGLRRCGKSCRLRWLNYLRPNIKHGGFSEEEDNIICSLYISIGSRWSIIAAQMPGRTDNDIKNYWNTKLKKKLLARCKEPRIHHEPSPREECQEQLASGMGHETFSRGVLSASAVERMQLHMQLHGLHSSPQFFNNPALRPMFHTSTGEQRVPHSNTTVEASPTASFPNDPETADCVADNNRGYHLDASSLSKNGFSSPPSSSLAPNMDRSDESFNSASGLQADVDDLLGEQDGELALEELMDCFRQMDGEGEGAVWWEDINGYEEKSSSSSWDSTSVVQHEDMFEQFVLGYTSKN